MGNFVPFVKMNGIGNSILIADMRNFPSRISAGAIMRLSCDSVVSFDQLLALYSCDDSAIDGDLEIYNSDGSVAQACGNGMRCLGSWLSAETTISHFVFRTLGGLLPVDIRDDGTVSVNMGAPKFLWHEIPLSEEFADTTRIELQFGPIDSPILHSPSVVNIGNPHAIFWTDSDLDTYDLSSFGPMLENHPLFPERANITIARVLDTNILQIRTWERGAGLTLACGSAACASAVCGFRTSRTDREVEVRLPGGILHILWSEDDTILMSGPTQHEFSGTLDPLSGDYRRD